MCVGLYMLPEYIEVSLSRSDLCYFINVHAFWCGKLTRFGQWLYTQKKTERMYCCAYYCAIAHVHTLIGRPGFPSMATGLH